MRAFRQTTTLIFILREHDGNRIGLSTTITEHDN